MVALSQITYQKGFPYTFPTLSQICDKRSTGISLNAKQLINKIHFALWNGYWLRLTQFSQTTL